jgi:uncharacterized protein YgbK (DUF1537 family)
VPDRTDKDAGGTDPGHAALVIIADDVTGAADAAAGYASDPKLRVMVALDGEASWPPADILAVDARTRDLPPAHAARAVLSIARRSAAQGSMVFKKIDSLLRGNISAEVVAALRGTGENERPLAVVTPAFPRAGRSTRSGRVYVHARPYLRGPFHGDVAQALAAGGLNPERILRVPRAGSREAVCRCLDEAHRLGNAAVVLDAVSEDDLEDIARAAESMSFPTLLVGSGGLAAHALPSTPGTTAEPNTLPNVSRTLLVVGSHSAPARAQVRALQHAGAHIIEVSPEVTRHPVDPGAASLALEGDVVLIPPRAREIRESDAHAVAEGLARVTCSIAQEFDALLLTGGDTARAVFDALGATHLRILGELEAGIVVGRPLPAPGPLVVTKAGAFGDAQALVRVTASLRRGDREQPALPEE